MRLNSNNYTWERSEHSGKSSGNHHWRTHCRNYIGIAFIFVMHAKRLLRSTPENCLLRILASFCALVTNYIRIQWALVYTHTRTHINGINFAICHCRTAAAAPFTIRQRRQRRVEKTTTLFNPIYYESNGIKSIAFVPAISCRRRLSSPWTEKSVAIFTQNGVFPSNMHLDIKCHYER